MNLCSTNVELHAYFTLAECEKPSSLWMGDGLIGYLAALSMLSGLFILNVDWRRRR